MTTLASNTRAQAPGWLKIEVGLVRVAPFRPGTQNPWDSPTPEPAPKGHPICHAIAKVAGLAASSEAGPLGGVVGSVVDRVLCSSANNPAQRRDPTAPDIFVSIAGADDITYRTFVVPDALSHLFQYRFVVPTMAIPQSGLRILVQDADNNSDEVIGQILVTRDQLLQAASSGELLALSDDTGAVQRLELSVGTAPVPGRVQFRLNTAAGTAQIPNVRIAAGQIVLVRALGQYMVKGGLFSRPRAVAVTGDPGMVAANYRLQTDPFHTAPHGIAIAMIGRAREIQPLVVGSCAIVVSPYDGVLMVGVNERAPQANTGVLDFDVEVANPRADLWARAGQRLNCPTQAR